MADHLVHLPEHFAYCYQFQSGCSNERCCEACLSMVAQIAFPGRYQDPKALMHELYVEIVGKGDPHSDNPSNLNGTTKEEALAWLQKVGIGHIDLSHLLGDLDNLKHELQAQNAQSVAQIITVHDMSKLRYAANDGLLYHWKGGGEGVSHVILRVGYSDDQGYGLYFDPAASPALPHPLPISWQSILEAGIQWACAVMPFHCDVPPAGFSYQHSVWPTPKPSADEVIHQLESQLEQHQAAIRDAVLAQLNNSASSYKLTFEEAIRALGAKV